MFINIFIYADGISSKHNRISPRLATSYFAIRLVYINDSSSLKRKEGVRGNQGSPMPMVNRPSTSESPLDSLHHISQLVEGRFLNIAPIGYKVAYT